MMIVLDLTMRYNPWVEIPSFLQYVVSTSCWCLFMWTFFSILIPAVDLNTWKPLKQRPRRKLIVPHNDVQPAESAPITSISTTNTSPAASASDESEEEQEEVSINEELLVFGYLREAEDEYDFYLEVDINILCTMYLSEGIMPFIRRSYDEGNSRVQIMQQLRESEPWFRDFEIIKAFAQYYQERGFFAITYTDRPFGFRLYKDRVDLWGENMNAVVIRIHQKHNYDRGLQIGSKMWEVNEVRCEQMDYERVLDIARGKPLPVTIVFQFRRKEKWKHLDAHAMMEELKIFKDNQHLIPPRLQDLPEDDLEGYCYHIKLVELIDRKILAPLPDVRRDENGAIVPEIRWRESQ